MFKNKNNNNGVNKMNNCYECGSDIIYPNDAFDVISKCSKKDCETNQIKKDQINSINHLENQKILNDQMDNS